MKKYIIIASMLAAAAVACTKEIDTPSAGTVISVTLAEQTKTAFGDQDGTSLPVLWSSGDQINVNGANSEALAEGGSATASFRFAETLTGDFYAVYPASVYSKNESEGRSILSIPATQTYTSGSYDPAVGVLVGKGDADGITLQHAMAYLRITLGGAAARTASIKVKANAGEALCGEFVTSYVGITPCGENSSEITVNCGNLDLGTAITVALPAKTYTGGLKISVTDENGKTVEKISTKSAKMEAGHLYSTSINVTEDAYYLIGGGFTNFNDWSFQEGLKLVPQGDGTYVSESDIYLNKWAYFRVAKADWSEDYSRVQGAAEYWSMQPKASGDEEPFIPGNFNDSWTDGYYMVLFDKNNMKLSCAYVGKTQNMPFYMNGGSWGDGNEDWTLVDDHKLARVESGIYRTVYPVTLQQWVYFKFDTADWCEYVRSQASGVDYWTLEAKNATNDCNFIPKNNNYDWRDGLYHVTLNLRTMKVICEQAVDPDAALYLFGGGFTDSSLEWQMVDKMALMPDASGVYKSVKPIYLNTGCYFKFDFANWTEYRRDDSASDFWTVANKNTGVGDNYFWVDQSGNYNVTVNLSTNKVTCELAQN